MSSSEKSERPAWSGKWAFILSAAASAVGLGNMWRFPYLAAKYGGGTFLLTYLLLVFTFGVSLLLLETSFGRHTRMSVFNAFRSFGNKYTFIGVLAAAVPFIITPYYCIIGGWVTKYMTAYIANSPVTMADGGEFFMTFITSPVGSQVFFLIFALIVIGVVAMGVKNGIEKVNLVMMPLLIIMAVGIAIFTLTIPGALEGAAYYLIPDFSKFSPELVIGALGQMFYSLSLAMAIMVTYGSYLSKQDSLTSATMRIAGFDFGISTIAGLMIVPAAFVAMGSAEAVAAKSGPSLMFITLPEVFTTMGAAAPFVGFIFFLLVFFAALTSAISLCEACTSILMDARGWNRRKALGIVGAWMLVVGVFVNMGYNILDFIQPLGEGTTMLDFADFISNSVMMPIVAILTCVFVGWIIKPQILIDEIRISSPFRAAGAWAIMIKYIAPVLVAVILVAYVAAQFGLFTM